MSEPAQYRPQKRRCEFQTWKKRRIKLGLDHLGKVVRDSFRVVGEGTGGRKEELGKSRPRKHSRRVDDSKDSTSKPIPGWSII